MSQVTKKEREAANKAREQCAWLCERLAEKHVKQADDYHKQAFYKYEDSMRSAAASYRDAARKIREMQEPLCC